MRNWNDPVKPKAHIELIPMIDVMMFLLVFFVLISLNVIPATGFQTMLPAAGNPQELKPQDNAIITIQENGDLQLDGKDFTLSGVIETLKAQNKQKEVGNVILRSDKKVSVEKLIEVMDKLHENGFRKVSIATRKI